MKVSPAGAGLDAIRLNLEDKAGSIEWLRVHSQGMLTPTITQPPKKRIIGSKEYMSLRTPQGKKTLFYHKCERTFTQLYHILHFTLIIANCQISVHGQFEQIVS